jgi:tripartite-type tricarboxylate transporter receptor subunit TctC
MVKQLALRPSPFWLSLLALVASTTGSPGAAEPYPSSMIRIVSATAAGTPPDIVCRIIANELAESEGWRVVVENKPGAIQTIGAAEALKQPADGYSILSIALPASAAPALLPNMGFSFSSDFVPVIKLASAYHVLVVNPSVPANSLPELVALLKRQPDKLTFSSGGFGPPTSPARCSNCKQAYAPRMFLMGRFREQSAIYSMARTIINSSRPSRSSI